MAVYAICALSAAFYVSKRTIFKKEPPKFHSIIQQEAARASEIENRNVQVRSGFGALLKLPLKALSILASLQKLRAAPLTLEEQASQLSMQIDNAKKKGTFEETQHLLTEQFLLLQRASLILDGGKGQDLIQNLFEKLVSKKPTPQAAIPIKNPYLLLTCSLAAKKIIKELLQIGCTSSFWSLFQNRRAIAQRAGMLWQTGGHLLKYIETIFSDPSLKKDLRTIWNSFPKKTLFLARFNKDLNLLGNLEIYATGFAESLKADPAVILALFKSRNWEGLIEHLLSL
jgi:hypothetical protein